MRLRYALLLAVAACVASPVSAANPSKIAITPESRDAAVIMRAPSTSAVYTLAIARYDPAAQDLSGGWEALPVPTAEQRSSDYVVQKVKPGTYVVRELIQQARWGVCFHAGTLQFDVKPGQAVYLGEFDAGTPLGELQRNALSRRDLVAGSYTLHNYFDGISTPRFTQPADPALPEVRAFMAEALPRTRVAPVAAQFRPATFSTGRALLGARVCGGMVRKKKS
ncbi:MAG TPA: hypothetical protein VGB65_11475 [Allosphingosinicella sp.]